MMFLISEKNQLILWTIQPEDFFEKSKKRGFLKADTGHIDPDFKEKYDWMAQKMLERGITGKRTYPVWAWYAYCGKRKQPDLRCSGHLPRGTKGVCIEFDADEKQVLLSLFDMWISVLNGFHIPMNDEEEAYYDVHPTLLTDALIKKSWNMIFDLGARSQYHAQPSEWAVQACVPIVYNRQIRRIVRFTAR